MVKHYPNVTHSGILCLFFMLTILILIASVLILLKSFSPDNKAEYSDQLNDNIEVKGKNHGIDEMQGELRVTLVPGDVAHRLCDLPKLLL